jgi:hypothetical protein
MEGIPLGKRWLIDHQQTVHLNPSMEGMNNDMAF